MKRTRRLLIVIGLAAVLCTGCWDFRSLDQRAFVLMAGVDRIAEERFRIILQIQLAGNPLGTPGGGAGGGKEQFHVITGEGDSVREAAERAKASVARDADATFLDTVVIGESAAKDLADLNWFVRYLRIPETAFVGVARGSAEPILRATSPGFARPADYTRRGFSGTWNRSAAIIRMPTWILLNRNFYTPLEDAWAPAMTSQKFGLNWNGMAVFNRHSLAGFLDETDAVMMNLMKGDRYDHTVTAAMPGSTNARVSMHIAAGKVKRWITWEGNTPVLHFRGSFKGDVQELTHMLLLDGPTQKLAESVLAAKVDQQMTAFLGRLQALDSDPLGFGELARQKNPNRREVKSREQWLAAYRHAKSDVQVNLKISTTGFMR